VIRKLTKFFYGSTPAEFKSDFGLADSVARLQAATRRSAFGVLAEQAAAGPVSESRVRLQRVIPMVGNSFKPFFYGRFEARDNGVYLIGCFTMLGIVKAFLTVWFGFVVLGIAFTVAQRGNGVMILGGFGFVGAAIALVGIGKWFARNDIAWLSNLIRSTLGAPVVVQTTDQPAGLASRGASTPPTVLRITALFLLVTGVMSIWSAISGISAWHSSPGHTVVTRFTSWPLRQTIGAYGLCMLGLAAGVYRRKQWAWRLGIFLIGASGLTTVFQAFASSQVPGSVIFRLIFCGLAVAVTIYWGRWWYAQRVHFADGANLRLRG
jgi:hypothetical protein